MFSISVLKRFVSSGTLAITGMALLFIAFLAARSWLEAHDAAIQLSTTLKAQTQLIAQADARQRARNESLSKTVAAISDAKRRVRTPAQAAAQIPTLLPGLPETLQISNCIANATFLSVEDAQQSALLPNRSAAAIVNSDLPDNSEHSKDPLAPSSPNGIVKQTRGAAQTASPGTAVSNAAPATGNSTTLIVPEADLKPLYDHLQDCRICQASLSVARQDLADEKSKSAALSVERDAALKVSRGGSLWTRLRRNAKWFLVGATAGAAVALASRH
jgi:hypothetical protein